MVCSKCGSKILEDQLFCSKCGHEINLVAEFDLSDDLMISPNITSEPERKADEPSNKTGALGFLLEQSKRRIYFFTTLSVLILSLFMLLVINYNKNQNSFDYHREKAMAYFEKNKFKLCIESAKKAIALNENEALPYELIARSYLTYNLKEEAFYYYNLALQKDIGNRSYYNELFKILKEKNRYQTIRNYIDASPIKDQLSKDYPMCFVAVPEFELEEGRYHDNIELRISSSEGTVIYYTLDGALPDSHSPRYENGIKLDKEGSYLVHAMAVNTHGIESDAVTAHYEIEYPIPSSPVVTPGTGKYSVGTLIKVVTEENCNAYYTWNRKIPDTNSRKYSLPVKMKEGSHTFTVVSINQFGKVSLPTVRSFDGVKEEE